MIGSAPLIHSDLYKLPIFDGKIKQKIYNVIMLVCVIMFF